ncbi:hypothetical protein K1719_046248 [Acacia pycnantha]|nr:hypothetical protein K1719_046248 [Acacia pycnantha]
MSVFLAGLLLLHCCFAMAETEYAKYRDPKQPLNVRIRDLMNSMTLEEKIGQMTQIERVNASYGVMNKSVENGRGKRWIYTHKLLISSSYNYGFGGGRRRRF